MFRSRFAQWREFRSGVATISELLKDGFQFLARITRSRAALGAEILFLRKQLAYYQEHEIRPRRLTDAARLSLVLWSRFFDWKESLAIVTTATFTRLASQRVQVVLAMEIARRPTCTPEGNSTTHRSYGDGERDLGRRTHRR